MKRIDVRGVPVLKMAMAADTKAQALKVLEEAAELVEAVKRVRRARGRLCPADPVEQAIICKNIGDAIDEAADVITATVGLLFAMGCSIDDIAAAMQECAERQERRGRE